MRPVAESDAAEGNCDMKTNVRRAYRSVMRSITPNSGLTRLSFNAPVNMPYAGAPTAPRASMRDGLPREAETKDDGRALWLFGSSDRKVSRAVNALLAAGDVFLDIGADRGAVGFAASHVVGSTGRVHLFEPQPRLAARLREVVRHPNTGNVDLHPCALYDTEGQMTLSVPKGHPGRATLLTSQVAAEPEARYSVRVPVYRTRDYLSPLVDGRPFGAKLDVAGAEPRILKDVVAFPNLKFVVFRGDRNERQLFDLLGNAGFTIYGLCRTVLAARLRRVDDLTRWSDYQDFVAVRREVAGRLPARIPLRRLAGAMRRGTRNAGRD